MQVADAQDCREDSVLTGQDSLNSRRHSNSTSNKKKSRQEIVREDAVDPLTPIREFEENDEGQAIGHQGKTSRTSNDYVKSYISLMRSQRKPEAEVKFLSQIC